MIQRRDFVRTLLTAAGSLAVPAGLSAIPAASGLGRIGIQLYSVRDLFAVDPVGTLRQLGIIGYREVELAGLGDRTASEIRAALDKAHIDAPSAHFAIEPLRENLSLVLGIAQTLELKYIVIPWLPAELRTPSGYKEVASILNQAGNAARRQNLTLAYHNQDYDFVDLGGATGYSILLEETDPDAVKLELDVFWMLKGGEDPLAYLSKYRDRFHMIHIKDMAADGSMVDVGTGTVDWLTMLKAAERAGVKHYFVEHDNPASPMGFAKASYDYLYALKW